jgi:hypothetical protein
MRSESAKIADQLSPASISSKDTNLPENGWCAVAQNYVKITFFPCRRWFKQTVSSHRKFLGG